MFDLFNLEQETEQVTKNILNKAKKETIKKVTKQIETESETKQETESEKIKNCMTVGEFTDRLQDLIKKGYGDFDIFIGYSLQWKKIFNVYKSKSLEKVVIDSIFLEDDYKTFKLSEFTECFLKENFNKDFEIVTKDFNGDINKVVDIDIDIDDSITIGIE